MKSTVAIAGASGFIGRALTLSLLEDHTVLALTRQRRPRIPDARLARAQWRCADLGSVREAEHGLNGASVAYYLVHSMASRQIDASFADIDLWLADNFARAAQRAGVEHIVYLGGPVPEGEELSPHLASRAEVEQALAHYGADVTRLRASLIAGRGGASFEILIKLVRNSPIVLAPGWADNRTQPIDQRDVVRALVDVLDDDEARGGAHDIGGPEVMTYLEMIQQAADVVGLRRPELPAPAVRPQDLEPIVSLLSGHDRELVRPLLESLQHDTVAVDTSFQDRHGGPRYTFAEAVAHAVHTPRGVGAELHVAASTSGKPARPPLRTLTRVPADGRTARQHTRDRQSRSRARWLPLTRFVEEPGATPERAVTRVRGAMQGEIEARRLFGSVLVATRGSV